jgi:hypothetical protein
MSKSRKKPTLTAATTARPSADLVTRPESLARPVSEQSLVWASAGAILISAVVLLGMLAAPWLRGNVYTGGDLQSFNLPIRKFYADCLERGDNPIWWPYIYCGFYLHGDGQTGIFHPGHWLLYRLLPLVAAFNIELLINYPLLFAGTYLFCRRRQLPVVPALFGGFLFALCRFNVNHLDHPNLMATMTHVPWLLWLLDVLLTAARPGQAAGAALAIALLTGFAVFAGPSAKHVVHDAGRWVVCRGAATGVRQSLAIGTTGRGARVRTGNRRRAVAADVRSAEALKTGRRRRELSFDRWYPSRTLV